MIDFNKVFHALDEMLYLAGGDGNREHEEMFSPMRDLLLAELEYAQQMYLSDEQWEQCFRNVADPGSDDIEVDADARVSLGDDDGAYVQCWVWVDGGKARLEAQARINAGCK